VFPPPASGPSPKHSPPTRSPTDTWSPRCRPRPPAAACWTS
jgi:hypothetical protein